MKKLIDDVRLMIKVCDLYYNQNIGQQQIAAMLHISRPTVSRLLGSSREKKIVKIQVSNLELVKHWEIENQLKSIYKFKDVVVVDSCQTEEEMKDKLGKAAARYLEYQITDNSIVGISMGSTLYSVVDHITEQKAENVIFVPLIGGMGRLRMELHSNSLAERLSRKYKSKFIPLQAPARISSELVRDDLMREESIAKAMKYAEKVELAIVGIGYPNDNSSITKTGYFKDNEIEILKNKNVAGEICMQFYNIDGYTSAYRNDNHVMGLVLSKLRRVPISIGVAGGIEKFRAIKGAVKGRYINVLITDFDCARVLIENK